MTLPPLTPLARLERPASLPHGRITALGALPDGRLVTAHLDKVAQRSFLVAWRAALDGGRVMGTQQGVVRRVAALGGGRLMTASTPSGDDYGTLCFWPAPLDAPAEAWPRHLLWRAPGAMVVRDYEWTLEVRAEADGALLRRVDTGALRRRFNDPFAPGPEANGHHALFALAETELVAVPLAHPGAWRTLHPATPVSRLVMAPEGPVAALVGFEGELEVWSLEEGRCLRSLTSPERPVVPESVTFWPGGRLAAADEEGALCVWSLDTGAEIAALPEPPDLHPPESVSGPPDRLRALDGGRAVAMTCLDQFARVGAPGVGWSGVWEARGAITALGVDGRRLLVGDQDGGLDVVSWG